MTLIKTVMTSIQTIDNLKKKVPHAQIKLFFREVQLLTTFFIVDEEREDPNTIKCVIIGSPAKRHLNCQQNAI